MEKASVTLICRRCADTDVVILEIMLQYIFQPRCHAVAHNTRNYVEHGRKFVTIVKLFGFQTTGQRLFIATHIDVLHIEVMDMKLKRLRAKLSASYLDVWRPEPSTSNRTSTHTHTHMQP